MGHEGAAIIEAIGAGVEHFSIGQRVLMNWAIPCCRCPQCLTGNNHICERSTGVDPSLGSSKAAAQHTLWHGEPIERSFNLGTFSEYSLVRAEALTALRDTVAMSRACVLGCGVMTGVSAVINSAKVQPGDTATVVGCGGVGLSAIQGARIAGASQIIAIDTRAVSLRRAMAAGATHTVLVDPDDHHNDRVVQTVSELTQSRFSDHAFEATGVAALSFLPLRLVRNGGNALQIEIASK